MVENAVMFTCDACGREQSGVPFELEMGKSVCKDCMQNCYVVHARLKRSSDWLALGVTKTKEEAEELARDVMSKIPFLDSYEIVETAYLKRSDRRAVAEEKVQEISPKELRRKVEAGDRSIELLDVREEWELEKGRLPGAIWIGMKDLPHRMGELSKDQEYIVYCTAGYRAHYACLFLQENGYRVKNLTGGLLGWKGLGLVVPALDKAMTLTKLFRKRKWEGRSPDQE